jgi:hypothetical protein
VRPDRNIDWSRVSWVESPARDPFAPGEKLDRKREQAVRLALQRYKLSAIWRDAGKDFSVINGMVLAVGDTLEEFKIEAIEHDHVWLAGPAGRLALHFQSANKP